MGDKIKNSIVAKGAGTISRSKNINSKSIKRVKAESAIIGFVSGILISVISSYIYDHFLK